MAQVEVPSQDSFGPQLSQRGLHVDCVPGHDRVGHQVQAEDLIRLLLRLYGLPITEENYSRAGSVLVALRKEFDPSEMDILDCVIRSHVPGAGMSFPDSAALCAVGL